MNTHTHTHTHTHPRKLRRETIAMPKEWLMQRQANKKTTSDQSWFLYCNGCSSTQGYLRGVKPRPHSNTKEARNQAWERRKQKQQHTHGESNARPPSTTASTPWRKPHRQLGLLCTNLQGSDDCILVFLNSLMGKLGCGQQTHALQCKIPGRHTNIPKDMYTQAKKCSLRHVHIKKHLQRIYVNIKKNICKGMYAGIHIFTHKETSPKMCRHKGTSPRCVDRKSKSP